MWFRARARCLPRDSCENLPPAATGEIPEICVVALISGRETLLKERVEHLILRRSGSAISRRKFIGPFETNQWRSCAAKKPIEVLKFLNYEELHKSYLRK